jgi:cold shock CspA family protein
MATMITLSDINNKSTGGIGFIQSGDGADYFHHWLVV